MEEKIVIYSIFMHWKFETQVDSQFKFILRGFGFKFIHMKKRFTWKIQWDFLWSLLNLNLKLSLSIVCHQVVQLNHSTLIRNKKLSKNHAKLFLDFIWFGRLTSCSIEYKWGSWINMLFRDKNDSLFLILVLWNEILIGFVVLNFKFSSYF